MPLHDWTRVTPNQFHDMHTVWLGAIRTRLNKGVLPDGYYAAAEVQVNPFVPDVLTLGDEPGGGGFDSWSGGGGTATASARAAEETLTGVRKSRPPARQVVVRRVAGDRLVAVIEVVSPGNKARASEVRAFVHKSATLLQHGVHVTVIDALPNPAKLPQGLGGRVWRAVRGARAGHTPRFSRTHSAFAAQGGGGYTAHFYSSEVGAPLPPLPLYLTPTGCIDIPVEESYQDAYAGYPPPWRRALEAPPVTP